MAHPSNRRAYIAHLNERMRSKEYAEDNKHLHPAASKAQKAAHAAHTTWRDQNKDSVEARVELLRRCQGKLPAEAVTATLEDIDSALESLHWLRRIRHNQCMKVEILTTNLESVRRDVAALPAAPILE